MKFEIEFNGSEISSILPDQEFKPRKAKKAAVFENNCSIDHCYLAFNKDEPRNKIYSICKDAQDELLFEVFTYDTVKEKATFENLRVEYRPVPYTHYEHTLNDSAGNPMRLFQLPGGITLEFIV